MEPGMVFTIEPIISEGSADAGKTWRDGWTVPTKDGSWTVQYEHTVLITEHGYEILTVC
jgi:methionyl aminopeptidase